MPIKVVSSTLNLAPKDALRWSAEQHRDFVKRTGYDGMTYYPLLNRLALDVAMGKPVGDFIADYLQPWREQSRLAVVAKGVGSLVSESLKAIAGKAGREPAGASFKARAMEILFDRAMYLGMPHLNSGLGVLSRVQSRIGDGVLRPVVVHPQGQVLGEALKDPSAIPSRRPDYRAAHRKYPNLGPFLGQPTVEWAHNRGLLEGLPEEGTDEELARRMIEAARDDGLGEGPEGKKEFSFDTGHGFTERQGRRFEDPVAIVGGLAAQGSLAAFEYSMQPRLGGDIEHLRETVYGDIANTPQGEMLKAAASNTPAGEPFLVRVEVPAYAMQEVGFADYQQGHAELVPKLREFAAQHLPA